MKNGRLLMMRSFSVQMTLAILILGLACDGNEATLEKTPPVQDVRGAQKETLAAKAPLSTRRQDLRRGALQKDILQQGTSLPLFEPAALSKERKKDLAVAKALRMRPGLIEQSCLRYVGADCVERSLDAFVNALEETNQGKAHTRTIVFGNSLIASDHIVDIIRETMVAQFGDGGRGFLLADRMADYGRRTRTGITRKGFSTFNLGQGDFGVYPHGLPGVLHVTTKAASTRWLARGASRARLFWWDHPKASPFSLWIDGSKVLDVTPQKNKKSRIESVDVPAGAKNLIFKTARKGTVLYGASLEREKPGFILDTFGVVASDASLFLKTDLSVLQAQLSAVNPNLVMLMLGGNEIKRVAWGRSSTKKVRADLTRFIRRIKKIVPQSGCLLVGPLENVRGKNHRRPFATRPQVSLVNNIQREVALEEGCAFYDLFQAMGGSGAMKRMSKKNLLHDDLVHPKGRGLDIPGTLIVSALFQVLAEPRSVPEKMVAQKWDVLSGAMREPAQPKNGLRARLGTLVTASTGGANSIKDHSDIKFEATVFSKSKPVGEALIGQMDRIVKNRLELPGNRSSGKPLQKVPSHRGKKISWRNNPAYGDTGMHEKIRSDEGHLQVHFLPPATVFESSMNLEDGGSMGKVRSSTCIVISESNALQNRALEHGCYYYSLADAFGPKTTWGDSQFLNADKTEFTETGFRYIAHGVWADIFATLQQ
jgi:lysophospholipase L1-like esterase